MSLTAATRSETTKQFTTSIWWVLAVVLFAYVGFTAAVRGGAGLALDTVFADPTRVERRTVAEGAVQ